MYVQITHSNICFHKSGACTPREEKPPYGQRTGSLLEPLLLGTETAAAERRGHPVTFRIEVQPNSKCPHFQRSPSQLKQLCNKNN